MITVFGEILIDRFPEYERIGGAPFNFAFHLKNMGWPVKFVTRIGDDPDGVKISRMLEINGFNIDDVQVDHEHATGRVEVTLDGDGIPNFDIRENAAHDHIDLSTALPKDKAEVDMVYFGTLIQRTRYGFNQVQQYLKKCDSAATRFCDINFRSPHINKEAIAPSLQQADILKLNDEELEQVSAMCNGPSTPSDIIDWLMAKYEISVIALTHGAQGSTAYSGGQSFHAPPSAITHIVDTVGAGDAYASVLAAGSLTNLPMDRILGLAGNFSAEVCGLPGAIPEDNKVYTSLIKEFERTPNAQ